MTGNGRRTDTSEAGAGSPRLPEPLEEVIGVVIQEARLPHGTAVEVEAELRAHFEDGLAKGRSPAELAEAFGDPGRAARWILRSRRDGPLAEDWLRPRTVPRAWRSRAAWSGWGRGLAQTLRTLRRSPGFAVAAILTLAVGIGANTAVFSVLDAVLLSPLPYPEPDRLVRVYEIDASDGSENFLRAPGILEWREWGDIFEEFGTLYTYAETGADLVVEGPAQRVLVSTVDSGFFSTLGAVPFLGRSLQREDESLAPVQTGGIRAGSPRVVLSEGLWRTFFGGDAGIVGRSIELDGIAFEVVGVLPGDFENPFGTQPDLWIPLDMTRNGRWNGWDNFWLSGVARLAEGVSVEQAQTAMRLRHSGLAAQAGYSQEEWDEWVPGLEPLQSDLVGQGRSTLLWFIFAAVGLVLLSACVNVANLFLVRSMSRSQELAVRASLGSTRSRIVLHLLGEAGVLAALGGLAGLGLGWTGVGLLVGVAPEALPSFSDPELNLRVVLFTGVIAAATALLFGLVPAIRVSRPAGGLAFRQGRRQIGDRTTTRLRDGLVVAEVGVALTLVIGAALLARSFAELQQVRLGVEPDGVLTFEVHLPDSRYGEGEDREALYAELQREVERIPEIASLGAVSWLPVNGPYNMWPFSWTPEPLFPWEEGGTGDDSEITGIQTNIRIFRGDYLGALGIDVLVGEPPDPYMTDDGERVVWVNRELVRRVFDPLDLEPVGASVWVANERRTVAGVVEDFPLDRRGTLAPHTFVPHAHYAYNRNWSLIQTAKLRPGADPAVVERLLVDALRGVDPDLVFFRPRTFETVLSQGLARDRFAALLMIVLAGLALVLAVIGTYGVLAYGVGIRRREIGIRMALGAEPASVRALVANHGLRLLGLGLAFGLAGAWGAARWIQSLLFGVDTLDPAAWLVGPAVLLGAGILAGWLPTLRAAAVDPARTLSAE